MRKGAASPHLGRYPGRFHQFLGTSPCSHRCLSMALNTVGTLRDMGHDHRDSLFHLAVQSSVGEYLLREVVNRSFGVAGETLSLC